MQNQLGKISIQQKSGNEPLTFNNHPTDFKLIDFWRWSVSDIVSNATRGILAEFIVASALQIDLKIIRDEWNAYDLTSPEGIKIEVKSASYIQSWYQKDYSKISFSIKEARAWSSDTNKQSDLPSRSSDVYVFCLLKHRDQLTLDPMNMDQWEFYILSTRAINKYKRSKISITLKSLQALTTPVSNDQIKATVTESIKELKRLKN